MYFCWQMQEKIKPTITKAKLKWISAPLLLAILLIGIISTYTVDRKEIYKSEAQLKCISCYELTLNGQPVLSFNADTITTAACWIDRWAIVPSCKGRLLTISDSSLIQHRYSPEEVRNLLKKHVDSLQRQKDNMRNIVEALQYYARVHDVRDIGYGMIADYGIRKVRQYRQISHDLYTIHQVKSDSNRLQITYRVYFKVKYKDAKGDTAEENCHLIKILHHRYLIVQTDRKEKPQGVTSQPLSVAQYIVMGTNKSMREPIDWTERPDSAGIYIGELNQRFIPEGHGAHIDNDGSYYEGHWSNGKRNGFGFLASPKKGLRVGEWKNNVYLGEKLIYNSERIYGIDISKYQHIKGRHQKHYYAIDWAHLKITHLGNLSKKIVSGTVNYPLRFVFIKNTEGMTLFNPYYLRDYEKAKAHGYRVGTYHFFSIRTDPAKQAWFYLKRSKFGKGDLPPVLDVEPYPSQIRKMGGEKILFGRVRTWLRIVQQHTGIRPILYVNQIFVNKYLNSAPDIKQHYYIWIAHYGEYKPDIRLAFWQLCPDGGVRGIRGEVDINVFNGYEQEYKKFLQKATIR
ncbi:MAG: glycosyl hydrolase family 25 [Prevotella sp.]|nr:glycosyl hydrolase family 25 [Prevotella sp.]MCH4186911.1 glycosyl hydrolase family 25 [Prevotella sp.]MCH4216923.1 glycosyl hydrolase family 25 [Prevotella sp.]MCH4252281.1 glycosyl hydrolase family 25 [Prevotella sp.]MCI1371828.1 glycosyl hydrolase family 25 [Prevotella sp.]